MAKCTECQQEMRDNKVLGCPYDIIEVDGVYYYRSRFNFGEESGRCNDCNAQHGQIHHWGCDVERCPRCGYQLISCDCWEGDIIGLYVRKNRVDIKDDEIRPATEPVGSNREESL